MEYNQSYRHTKHRLRVICEKLVCECAAARTVYERAALGQCASAPRSDSVRVRCAQLGKQREGKNINFIIFYAHSLLSHQ